jgi:hypothetical protein
MNTSRHINKYDDLNLPLMGKPDLQDVKYMLECELSWIHKDMADSTESLMLDDALDIYNKFAELLKEVNFRLKRFS